MILGIRIYKESKEEDKDKNRYNQAPHLTQDSAWESDKNLAQENITHKRANRSAFSQEASMRAKEKVSKGAKIRKRYNQVPQLTQDTAGESDKNTRKHYTEESQ